MGESTPISYDVRELESVAPIFRSGARGIYVLVFANGERYVGQTVDFTHRFATHRHGGRHHAPWTDIVGVEFRRIDEGDLTGAERETIAQQRALGHRLRNKTWNFDFAGSSALDHWIPPVQQEHWSTGGGVRDLAAIASAARRPSGPEPRLFTERRGRASWAFNEGDERWTVADLVVADLAAILDAIPQIVELEGEYWTISDFPSTSGGRFATLNAGSLELLYIPRWEEELGQGPVWTRTPCSRLNLLPGTFITDEGEWNPALPDEVFGWIAAADRVEYPMTWMDQITVPVGLLPELMDIAFMQSAVRRTSLALMRKGPSSMFKRWHSPELARRAYEEILIAHDDTVE
ncbi:GIY-YIG nuclease family protein [Actinomyces culturomici]|uniref:GIY-YIG nuclease family protein n=1 Tax=Actinomyces culturomici TaxID=1926276 RepID=UPI00135BD75F|nr:GIY-YIG nuclease family protein [Actinomyces culturomici]